MNWAGYSEIAFSDKNTSPVVPFIIGVLIVEDKGAVGTVGTTFRFAKNNKGKIAVNVKKLNILKSLWYRFGYESKNPFS